MRIIKRVCFAVINGVSILIIAAAIVVLCRVLMTKPGKAPDIFGYTLLRVTTGSMAPTYETDTLIVVRRMDASEIQVGDVISFYSTDPVLNGALNTHRVTAVTTEAGRIRFTTKGDGNNIEDPYPVDEDALLGKVIGSSLLLGKAARLAVNPLIFVPFILIPLAVILFSNLFHTIRLAKKIAKEEETAAVEAAIRQIREKQEQERADMKEEKN